MSARIVWQESRRPAAPSYYDFDADARTVKADAVPLSLYRGEVSGDLWTRVAGQAALGPRTAGRVVAQGMLSADKREWQGLRWFAADIRHTA